MATRNFNVKNGLTAGNITLDASTNTTTTSNLVATGNVSFTGPNVSLGSVSNLKISGGTGGYVLSTDGSGNLSWVATSTQIGGAYVFTQSTPATTWVVNHNLGVQYVNVQVIDANGVSYTGRYNYPTITFNNAAALTITFDSAVAGYAAVTSGGGQQNVGGSNTQIQFNDGNILGGSAALTFNKTSNLVSMGGALSVTGNANVGNIGATRGVFTNIAGEGGNISNIQGANVSGTVSSATAATNADAVLANFISTSATTYLAGIGIGSNGYTSLRAVTGIQANLAQNSITATTFFGSLSGAATTAGTVTTAAQPNITSVGTLSSLAVTGNVTAGNFVGTLANGNSNVNITTAAGNVNITVNGTSRANFTTSGLAVNGTIVTGSNVTAPQLISNVATGTAPFVVTSTTQVANLSVATAGSATTAGTVTTAAQPNITSVGTLTSLGVSGAVTASTLVSNVATGTAPLTVTSTTKVANLNVEQVDGYHADIASTANTIVVRDANSDIFGNNYTGRTFTSNVATGTAPLAVTSTTRVANLNVAYANVADFISVSAPGTGTGYVVFANTTSGNVTEWVSSGITSNLANNSITATTFIGSLSGAATTAGTVTTAAQPNITSVGTLTSLAVTGNATAGNVYANSGTIGASLLTGTLTTAAQPNVTSVGTLTSLAVTGNVTAGNLYANSGVVGANTLSIANTASIGGNLAMNSKNITGLADPVNPQDAATKNYVDATLQGLHVHDSCYVGTTGTLATASGGTTSYNNGTSGVGATITTTGTFTTIDGLSIATVGTRVLVKNESNAAWNGIYTYTNATTLTRATDFDTSAEAAGGDFVFITSGNTLADTGWVQTTDNPTIGTSNIVWTQFSGAGTYTAGTGLTLTGTVFSITNTAVTAGSYGNGDRVATFTVNNQGQLTAAANTAITANAANLTGTTLNSSIVTSSLTSVGTLGSLSVTGNANTGNLGTTTVIATTGNITTINSGLMQNGNSNVAITANGNVTISAVGGARITATSTGANVTGTLGVSGNANVNNLGTQQVVATDTITGRTLVSTVATGTAPLQVTSTTRVANLNVATAGAADTAGTVTTAAQPNITSVGTLTGLTSNGNVTVNVAAGNRVSIAASAPPTVDMFQITNTGQGVTTAGVSGMQLTYVGGAAAVEASAYRTDLTPGGTTGGTWNGFRFVPTSNVASGVTMNGIKIDTIPGAPGAGTENAIFVGANWDNLVNYNGTPVIFGNGQVNAAQVIGTLPNAVTNNITNVGTITSGTWNSTFTAGLNANTLANIQGGNVSGAVASATTAGTVTTAAQPNITSVGTLTSLGVSGAVTASTLVSNVAIGTAPLTVTSTTRVANLNVATAGVSDNITVASGTGNNFIVFANVATGTASELTSSGLTANLSNNSITATTFVGSLSGAATTAGTVTTAAQPNITSVGTLTSLGVNGTVTAVAFTANTGVFTGNGSGLSAIAGANVTGTVANATFATSAGSATTAGTVTTAAQPNITSVGTLSSLAVTGNATANNFVASTFNLNTSNAVSIANGTVVTYASQQGGRTYVSYDMNTFPQLYESRFVNVAGSTNIPSGASGTGYWFGMGAGDVANRGFDLFGTSANAMYFRAHDNGNSAWIQLVSNVSGTAVSATTSGTVTTAAQPNITSVGTLTSVNSSGNISGANVISSAYSIVSVGTGISAAGTTQGTATALSKQFNVVSTVASGAGVVLPTAVAGMRITVINTSANALLVYPASTGIINSAAANAAYSQPAGARLDYISTSTTQWYTLNATYG